MEAILVLVGWYGIGLGTAWVMSRAGHDPFPWVLAGWLTGAWAAVVAAFYVRYQRRRPPGQPSSVTPTRRVERRVTPPRGTDMGLRNIRAA